MATVSTQFAPQFPKAFPGASLVLCFAPPRQSTDASLSSSTSPSPIPSRRTILIIGCGRLAAVRSFSALEAGYRVMVAGSSDITEVDDEIRYRLDSGELGWIELPERLTYSEEESEYLTWLNGLGFFDDISIVLVTDTLLAPAYSSIEPRPFESSLSIRRLCHKLRIPLNVADTPSLSDFSWPVTHRFPCLPSTSPTSAENLDSIPALSPLQIALTTNSNSCRLASRLKREIVSLLPKSVGSAVKVTGELRQSVRQMVSDDAAAAGSEGRCRSKSRSRSRSRSRHGDSAFGLGGEEEELVHGLKGSINAPVPQLLRLGRPAISQSISTPNMRTTTPSDGSVSSTPSSPSTTLSSIPQSSPAPTSVSSSYSVADNSDSYDLTLTRMRWIAQISEYWPLDRLAKLEWDVQERERVLNVFPGAGAGTGGGVQVEQQKQSVASCGRRCSLATTDLLSPAEATDGIVSSTTSSGQHSHTPNEVATSQSQAAPQPLSSNTSSSAPIPATSTSLTPRHGLDITLSSTPTTSKQGRILLVGSGPGSPHLLTLAAHSALTKYATLVLSDKLVPSQILALIPGHVKVHIAKKFPGNAEGAQNELMELAVEGARKGETVVRLKQGDPYVYGRGGEEVLHFRSHGFEPVLIPGLSSVFAGPLLSGIPVTQRGVAESMILCTGVGRGGRGVKIPGYERGRSLVLLMGVARLDAIVKTLTTKGAVEGRDGSAYPSYLPIAIIERASSPDQRVISSTLEKIINSLERAGEQRPPGMMVIGWSVLALEGEGDVKVLDDSAGGEISDEEEERRDRARVEKWLKNRMWTEKDGVPAGWEELYRAVEA